MNKIFSLLCALMLSPVLAMADEKPAPAAPKQKPAEHALPAAAPAVTPAPAEVKDKSADEEMPIALKNKSSFNVDPGIRSPFWPISWKPAVKIATGGAAQGEIPPGAFLVTTITVDGATRFAIINGKTMSEGQTFGLQMGTKIFQVTVKQIDDGRVILGQNAQEIVIPLRRK